MSGSVVFYRFKAQKEPSTVQFEGTGISVWDLKKEILAENKLGKGADFDFAIYNSDTNEGGYRFLFSDLYTYRSEHGEAAKASCLLSVDSLYCFFFEKCI